LSILLVFSVCQYGRRRLILFIRQRPGTGGRRRSGPGGVSSGADACPAARDGVGIGAMIDARPETERLIPRKLREEDEEDLFRYASDPEIHNENAGRFAPRQTVEGFFSFGQVPVHMVGKQRLEPFLFMMEDDVVSGDYTTSLE